MPGKKKLETGTETESPTKKTRPATSDSLMSSLSAGRQATAANILQTQGLTGFTTGFGRATIFISTRDKYENILVPRAVRRTLMAALAWTVYEKMIRSIGLK